jgi:hypothetical protein
MPIRINGTGTITGVGATGISAQPVFPGNVLQVVSATYSTETVTQSTSYVDSGLSASIAPSSNTSKILVLVSQLIGVDASSTTQGRFYYVNLVRNNTQIAEQVNLSIVLPASGTTSGWSETKCFSFIDSPGTTSSITYKTRGKVSSTDYRLNLNLDNSLSSIVLLEVAA